MTIYAHMPLDEPERRLLLEGARDDVVLFGADVAAFREAEVAFGNVPPEWLAASRRLRWIQLESAGYEAYLDLDWPALRGRITLTNVGDLYGPPVAETALAGILSLYRGIGELRDLQREKRWRGHAMRPELRLLHGATAIVLGTGAIGRSLRAALVALGCRVHLMGRTAPDADLYTGEELDAVLPESDVVACCLPDTPETRGLIDRRRLARMKPGALFVNVGRGTVVDEPALVEGLRSGRIGGAVLDVTLEEPLPPDHPLWSCPNTLLTQHTGGGSEGESEAKISRFLGNLARYRRGDALRYVVRL